MLYYRQLEAAFPYEKEGWENQDVVTLITRPRRFGKTLTMSMVEQFFSIKYAGRRDLFEGLTVWEDEQYRKLQGTYPVIFLSFANVKGRNFSDTRKPVCELIAREYTRYAFLLDSDCLTKQEKEDFQKRLRIWRM